MSVPMHLSLVTLGVRDVARSTAFYESLGWRRSADSQPAITFLRLDNVAMSLFGVHDLAADAGRVGGAGAAEALGPGSFRGVSLAINVLSPTAVDRLFAEFVAAGATPVKQPVAAEWGGYSGYAADPDGHLWELAYNPYSPEWAAPVSE